VPGDLAGLAGLYLGVAQRPTDTQTADERPLAVIPDGQSVFACADVSCDLVRSVAAATAHLV
jgi:hypothetical protein